MKKNKIKMLLCSIIMLGALHSPLLLADTITYKNTQIIKTIPSIEIEKPQVFEPRSGSKATSSRMTIHNNGDTDLIITGFTSDAFKKTMLHDVKFVDGQRTMFHIDQIIIPAHQKKAISPNTTHFMMLNPTKEIHKGEYIKMDLTSNLGTIPVILEVVPYRLK